MRFILIATTVIAIALYAPQARAQDEDQQVWTTIGASGEIADNVNLSLEALGRFGNDAGGLYEAEFGGFVGYELPSGVEIAVGYVRVPGYDHGDVTKKENRLRQQVSFPIATIGSGKLSGRVRLEERFRADGTDTGYRLRPQIKYSLPLGASKTSLFVSHESFFELNDTDWGQNDGYSRMRNSIGIKAPLFGKVSGSIAYLNQYDFGRDVKRDRMAHVADISLSIGF